MDEHEHRIITEISKRSDASQRHLSKVSNLSLGMVNIVLHRLIEKGYMKIKQLDGRKVQYILTPKGFSEKVKRSQQYIQNTISSLAVIKDAIKKVMTDHSKNGVKRFVVLGRGEIRDIIDISFRELGLPDVTMGHKDSLEDIKDPSVVALCIEGIPANKKNDSIIFIDIQKVLAEAIG